MVKLGPYILGPADDPNQGIYTGDARELAKAIPDESVDLIFTDPVYDRIDDYRWLAETAARVLKPNGQVLIYQAHAYLPATMEAMSSLRYVWTLAEEMNGATARMFGYGLFVNWRPLLWYAKSKVRPFSPMGPDLARAGIRVVGNHRWRKNYALVGRWMRACSANSDVIWEPFAGGGTVPAVCKMLGRHWLAFEIDPATADTARERVRNTQPPLFVPQPEQLAMEV